MNARFEDGEEQLISMDHYTCPITRRIMRHPVLAADGRHYELQALLRYAAQGHGASPVRAGRGTIFPVVYDAQLQEMLDQVFEGNADRFEEYEDTDHSINDLVDQINQYGTELLVQSAVRQRAIRADDDQIHIVIGNKIFGMFFIYAIFNWAWIAILNISFFGRDTSASISTATLIETSIMTMAMIVTEAKLRIANDDEFGIVGGIANHYYSLFKRAAPARNVEQLSIRHHT